MLICEKCRFQSSCELNHKEYNEDYDFTCANYAPFRLEKVDYEAKADKGKLKISLVPTQIIKDIAQVRMYGNEKYGDPENWKQVEMERYTDALLRHTLEFIKDNKSKDKESSIEHYKHMACNMAFICEMMNE
jgi:hypothetical protein